MGDGKDFVTVTTLPPEQDKREERNVVVPSDLFLATFAL